MELVHQVLGKDNASCPQFCSAPCRINKASELKRQWPESCQINLPKIPLALRAPFAAVTKEEVG